VPLQLLLLTFLLLLPLTPKESPHQGKVATRIKEPLFVCFKLLEVANKQENYNAKQNAR